MYSQCRRTIPLKKLLVAEVGCDFGHSCDHGCDQFLHYLDHLVCRLMEIQYPAGSFCEQMSDSFGMFWMFDHF